MEHLPVTVPEIARDLSVDQKRVRAWLRRQGWRSTGEHGTRWFLDEAQANQVRERFAPDSGSR
jgi:uncharacterized protein YjcR